MAKLFKDAYSIMSFGKTFERIGGQPLDNTDLWFSFEAASNYAKNDGRAYVGQKIAVIDEASGTVSHYSIKNVAGDLEPLGKSLVGDGLSVEVKGSTVSLKNFGKKYYKYVPATETTPATYELTDGFMDGLEVKVRKTTRTNDAGGPEEVYELAYYEPNPTTVEGLQSALTNVQAQAAEAKTAAEGALIEAQKKIADVVGIGAIDSNVGEKKIATIRLKLDNSGNVKFSETDTGLKATVDIPEVPEVVLPEYSIKKLDEATAGASASYQLTKDGTGVGAVIDIPKDMVISSGRVVTNPEGQPEGTYIEIVLANSASDKLYINVGDLIEYVTSGSAEGDMVVVTVDSDHKVTATITDGTVTKSKLTAEVQSSLDKADTSMQSITVLGFTLSDGSELTVDQAKEALGLGSAAYEDLGNIEATIDQKIETALEWSDIG